MRQGVNGGTVPPIAGEAGEDGGDAIHSLAIDDVLDDDDGWTASSDVVEGEIKEGSSGGDGAGSTTEVPAGIIAAGRRCEIKVGRRTRAGLEGAAGDGDEAASTPGGEEESGKRGGVVARAHMGPTAVE